MASQAIGLVQLVVLLWRVGANQATDAYFYLFNIGMLPIQILLVGVMYPLLLNKERMTQRGIRRVQWGTPLLSIVLMVGGAGYLYINDRLPVELWLLALFALVNAFVQALLWFRSVTAEAGGNPRWNAAIALPANALATLSLLLPLPSPAATATVMVGALVLGNSVLLAFALRYRIGEEVVRAAPTVSAGASGASWFATKSTVGYVGLIVLQSLAVLLPASAVTLLNVGVKIVGSIAATLVNAVMPQMIHHKTESIEPSRRFLRVLVGILAILSVLTVIGVSIFANDLLVPAICVGLWVVASTSSAVAQRMSFRFLPPSASRITLIAVPVVVLLALASSFAGQFQLVVLLCAYAAVDGASAALLLFSLRDRVMTWVLALTCLSLGTIWVMALV